jgi:Zn-dependent M28 family amino/carboxypeptidase
VSRTHLTVALACAAMLVAAPAAMAAPGGGKGKGHHGHHHGKKSDSKKLREGVTLKGMLEHQRALQRIAIANDGNRAATTPGYDASVEYVAGKLRAAGYDVTLDGFSFPIWDITKPSTFAQVTPTARTFVEDTDYVVSQFSSAANFTDQIVPIDAADVTEAGTSTSGCEDSDFAGTNVAGNIALMMRGTCVFVDKFQNAKDAGAVGAIIFNDGFEGRTDAFFITGVVDLGIPQMMVTSAVGKALRDAAATGPVTAQIVIDATTTPNTEYNVIADSRRGDEDRTILVGAHLDSVEEGAGINDNGSGSSAILEIAEQMARLKQPRNHVRFAFWGAEEAGLVGSTAYVADQVANGGINDIEANLNFDMLASPNFVRFVYDGDSSDTDPPDPAAPAGSAQIEQVFLRYFDRKGLATDPTAFDGRSDYGPFIANGVPAGGLFSGAEGIKTAAQEAVYGGFAGLAYDPCYHQACDDYFNLSHRSLDQMSDAAAHTTWTLARSRTPVADRTATSAAKKKSKKSRRMNRMGRFQYKGHRSVR